MDVDLDRLGRLVAEPESDDRFAQPFTVEGHRAAVPQDVGSNGLRLERRAMPLGGFSVLNQGESVSTVVARHSQVPFGATSSSKYRGLSGVHYVTNHTCQARPDVPLCPRMADPGRAFCIGGTVSASSIALELRRRSRWRLAPPAGSCGKASVGLT